MDFLELRREAWGSSQVVTGPSGTHSCCLREVRSLFELRTACRASSWFTAFKQGPVQSSVSGLSVPHQCLRDLRIPIKLHLGSQASSGVEAWNSAFLLSCQRGIRPPVEFRREIWASSRGSAWESGLPSCCEGILGVPLEQVQGNQDLSGAEGELGVLFPCSRIHGVPLEIQ